MISKNKITAFYLIAIIFIITNSYLIIAEDTLLLNLVPVALVVFVALFYSIDKVLLLSVLFVPTSLPLKNFFRGLDFNIDLPTEPIFICIMLVFVIRQLKEHDFDRKILRHPVSIAIICYLIWRAITVITSTYPLVSIKHFIMSIWFIIPFFFLMTQIARSKKNINKFFWGYIISFIIVITYTIIRHSFGYFSQITSHRAMQPFFNDHTSYGAALAMYIPILVGLVLNKDFKVSYRRISFIVLIYLIVAIILSYTRAAWVSLIGALGVYLMLKWKINYKFVLITAVVLASGFFIFQDQIFFSLERNKQDSSTDLSEHVKSITNVATDASNLERINRWNSAIRMYKEKPVFGWGPGTYQFNYAPFQFSHEKTIISTNAGDMGNAHSEYLGNLCESGIIGMVSYIMILLLTFITAAKSYYRAKSRTLKTLIASTLCGLTTYIIHGFLNNFLDTDKIAVPFWGFIAILVAVDVYLIKQDQSDNIQEA